MSPAPVKFGSPKRAPARRLRRAGLLGTLLLVGLSRAAVALAASANDPAPLCTDRPTKSTGTCTADAGHLQIESDLVSYSESTAGGVVAQTWVLLNPTVKYGITNNLDVEATAALAIASHAASGPQSETAAGVGDLYLKLKRRLPLGTRTEIALLPVLKLPTAKHGLGNGAVEWGLLVPVVVRLDDDWSLNLSPEIDRLHNTAGSGYHTASAQLINLSRSLPHDWSLSFEWWSAWDADPAGATHQAALDLGFACLLRRNLQMDIGVNRGINAATPTIQAYLGIAKRY